MYRNEALRQVKLNMSGPEKDSMKYFDQVKELRKQIAEKKKRAAGREG